MGLGSQSFGTSAFGSGEAEETEDPLTVAVVEPIAKDLVRVHFSEAVVVNAAFLNVDNYLIVRTSDSSPLVVKRVIPPREDVITTYVLLNTVRLLENVEYSININNIISRSGGVPSATAIKWEYKRTKTDSILKSIPEVYDKSPDSNIRQLMTAVSLSDNRIGGNPAEDL